jgi:hypothetical protein
MKSSHDIAMEFVRGENITNPERIKLVERAMSYMYEEFIGRQTPNFDLHTYNDYGYIIVSGRSIGYAIDLLKENDLLDTLASIRHKGGSTYLLQKKDDKKTKVDPEYVVRQFATFGSIIFEASESEDVVKALTKAILLKDVGGIESVGLNTYRFYKKKGHQEEIKDGKKLTLVSVSINGRSVSFFIDLPYMNGKPYLEDDVLNSVLDQQIGGGISRGVTISIG